VIVIVVGSLLTLRADHDYDYAHDHDHDEVFPQDSHFRSSHRALSFAIICVACGGATAAGKLLPRS
jgi:hypothetical protein